jgi:erythromycin esterase-like protein
MHAEECLPCKKSEARDFRRRLSYNSHAMKLLPVFSRNLFLPVCLLLACALAPAEQNPEQAATQWLRQGAIPLQTVEAGHGFIDMQPLKKIVGDARIVELGEATHGTREFFQLKHRMLEFLASQEGFSIFSIEANMPEAYRLNDFVLNGNGDPKALLKGMYFWTWNTEEVLDMILWMREFNKSGKGRIEFTGFDMQNPTVSMEIVRKFLGSNDRGYLDATVNPLYDQVAHIEESTADQFAGATAKLPIQTVAGKRVTVSGFIRSEDIANGYAGFWLRADDAKGVVQSAFRNMHENGVTGTTPWKRYEISVDVPADATAVYFGALHTGNGTAWFDSLSVAVNGVSYADPSVFDGGFESPTTVGFMTFGQGYQVSIDNTQAQDGKQSLRMRRIGAPKADPNTQITTASPIGKCAAVMVYLESNRSRYLAAGSSAKDIDWIVQNARIVQQYAQLKAGTKGRDESMAENIQWIAEHNPGARIVVWAHNGHVAYAEAGMTPMGSYLRKIYGDQLVNFGFAFNQGGFQAWEMGKGLHDFTVGPAPVGTLDHALAATGQSIFAVDLRKLPKQGPVAEWFQQSHPSRSIGAAYGDALAASLWSTTPANQQFDALFFVEKTSAARPNAESPKPEQAAAKKQ